MTIRKAISLCFAISILLCSCEKAEITERTETKNEKDKPIVVNDTMPHPDGVRDGSEAYPFLASDLSTGSIGQYILANNAEQPDCWVTGYIVGYIRGTSYTNTVFDDGDVESNIVISDNPYETEPFFVVPIQLSTGSSYAPVRSALNVCYHPENIHRKVAVFGKVCPYMKAAGMKNTRNYKFIE
ncbi:MAG: DUF6359 domain-containing protein [Bacteroidaceae bacterium]|nr:DUF6359 domain-containing protein [Bacteroidaceae bacterium]